MGESPVSNDIARTKERALELLRIGYLEVLNSDADLATIRHCAPQLGLDPEDDQDEFIRLASYLEGRRYIEQYASGFSMFTITPSGRELVEGEAPQPAQQVSTRNYTIRGDAYSPVMGEQQNVSISVSFDMRSVDVALDHAEAKADRLPAADAERVNELLAELRAMLRSGESVEPGRLSKYEDLVKKYGWLAGPVLSTLSNVAFRSIGG
jgi:hypothetical protein